MFRNELENRRRGPLHAILLVRLVELQMPNWGVVSEEQLLRALQERLKEHQVAFPGRQPSLQFPIEAYSLAILALRNHGSPEYTQALRLLLAARNRDGSWPAFGSDDADGCWATALAVLALAAAGRSPADWEPGIQWLLYAKGREAKWFWRWKFQEVDNSVKFDPAKYGWSWFPDTTSWVIPTAFSLIALQKVADGVIRLEPRFSERISLGAAMLLDRMCPGGGWNAGNSAAFGVPYTPYIDATAIALLALQRDQEPGVRASLSWLTAHLPDCPSPHSLAWGILGLSPYERRSSEAGDAMARAANALLSAIGTSAAFLDTATVSTCVLALEAVGGENVFEVGQ